MGEIHELTNRTAVPAGQTRTGSIQLPVSQRGGKNLLHYASIRTEAEGAVANTIEGVLWLGTQNGNSNLAAVHGRDVIEDGVDSDRIIGPLNPMPYRARNRLWWGIVNTGADDRVCEINAILEVDAP